MKLFVFFFAKIICVSSERLAIDILRKDISKSGCVLINDCNHTLLQVEAKTALHVMLCIDENIEEQRITDNYFNKMQLIKIMKEFGVFRCGGIENLSNEICGNIKKTLEELLDLIAVFVHLNRKQRVAAIVRTVSRYYIEKHSEFKISDIVVCEDESLTSDSVLKNLQSLSPELFSAPDLLSLFSITYNSNKSIDGVDDKSTICTKDKISAIELFLNGLKLNADQATKLLESSLVYIDEKTREELVNGKNNEKTIEKEKSWYANPLIHNFIALNSRLSSQDVEDLLDDKSLEESRDIVSVLLFSSVISGEVARKYEKEINDKFSKYYITMHAEGDAIVYKRMVQKLQEHKEYEQSFVCSIFKNQEIKIKLIEIKKRICLIVSEMFREIKFENPLNENEGSSNLLHEYAVKNNYNINSLVEYIRSLKYNANNKKGKIHPLFSDTFEKYKKTANPIDCIFIFEALRTDTFLKGEVLF